MSMKRSNSFDIFNKFKIYFSIGNKLQKYGRTLGYLFYITQEKTSNISAHTERKLRSNTVNKLFVPNFNSTFTPDIKYKIYSESKTCHFKVLLEANYFHKSDGSIVATRRYCQTLRPPDLE